MPKFWSKDVGIHYIEEGEGEALLFISGLVGLSKMWEFQFPYFSNRYRCISFDHRGSGESDKPKDGYTTSKITEDVVALLDYLGVERAHITGASTGGCILQNLCLDHSERVGRAIFTNTWTRADEYMTRLQITRRRILHAYGQEAYVDVSSIWTGGPTMFRNDLDIMLDLEKRQKETIADPDILTARIDMTLAHDRLDEIPNIVQPALIISAKDDPLTPSYFGEDLNSMIEGSCFHLLEYGGHNSYRRNSAGWNTVVDEFLGTSKEAG
jgi:aminoacrylate hydrolase